MASEAAKRYVREVMHIETGDCLLSEAFDAGASAMFDQFWEAAAIQGVPAGKYTPAELVVAIASAKEAELRQPMACEHPLADLNRRCGLPASSRSDVYCTRCAEIAKLKEPSSCGREGHLRIDWMPAPSDHICHEHCLHGRCLACLREDKRVREAYERGKRDGANEQAALGT